jgi:hypothetical protein
VRADAREKRRHDPRVRVEGAEFIAHIDVDRSRKESSGGERIDRVSAGVGDVERADGRSRKDSVIREPGNRLPVRTEESKEAFGLIYSAGAVPKTISWSASLVKTKSPEGSRINESESVIVVEP